MKLAPLPVSQLLLYMAVFTIPNLAAITYIYIYPLLFQNKEQRITNNGSHGSYFHVSFCLNMSIISNNLRCILYFLFVNRCSKIFVFFSLTFSKFVKIHYLVCVSMTFQIPLYSFVSICLNQHLRLNMSLIDLTLFKLFLGRSSIESYKVIKLRLVL